MTLMLFSFFLLFCSYERELVLSFTAAKGGVPLIGHSGEPTTVVIRLIIGAGCGTDPSLDSANFLLEICVDSARHLPQKDFLFGSCDPFVSVEFARQAYKTEVRTCASPVCAPTSHLIVDPIIPLSHLLFPFRWPLQMAWPARMHSPPSLCPPFPASFALHVHPLHSLLTTRCFPTATARPPMQSPCYPPLPRADQEAHPRPHIRADLCLFPRQPPLVRGGHV